MQRLSLSWRRRGLKVGLVPTMGCLHAGHASLIAKARKEVGRKGKLVVSVFVNPTQFGVGEDFKEYPRDIGRDRTICRRAGVDLFFAPTVEQMYPADTSTRVEESCLSQGLEGASRPSHFQGVATVVAKLFNLVLPSVAVFGDKDFQQLAVVRRMVRDLDFPVRIVAGATLREPDGLAMSSRNRYLEPAERAQATVLWRVIAEGRKAVRSGGPVAAGVLRRRLAAMVKAEPAARLDYIAFVEPATLKPLTRVGRGVRLVLAVRVGNVRLIDNATL